MKNWLTHLNLWSLQLTNTKQGVFTLFILAFADASILPLPVTTFFLVLVLLNTTKAYRYALFITLGTLAGALTGYAIGHMAWVNNNGEFTRLAQFMFNNIPGFSVDVYKKIDLLYSTRGFWILSLSASTPIPYGIFAVTSGVFKINIFFFCVSTFIIHGIKFYLLALLAIKSGQSFKKLTDFNWRPLAIITTICVIIAMVIINSF